MRSTWQGRYPGRPWKRRDNAKGLIPPRQRDRAAASATIGPCNRTHGPVLLASLLARLMAGSSSTLDRASTYPSFICGFDPGGAEHSGP